jgi:hypothetical protein
LVGATTTPLTSSTPSGTNSRLCCNRDLAPPELRCYVTRTCFSLSVAKLLERDRSLRRNFREEAIADLLMASLVGMEALGIRVDFPDETKTGGDMEWVFAAPLEVKGGRYLRLILQAKRPQYVKLKRGG